MWVEALIVNLLQETFDSLSDILQNKQQTCLNEMLLWKHIA